jgi:hypothetical protein
MVFFQARKDLIKTNIMEVFHNFHASSKFEKSLNATFINLIPILALCVKSIRLLPKFLPTS